MEELTRQMDFSEGFSEENGEISEIICEVLKQSHQTWVKGLFQENYTQKLFLTLVAVDGLCPLRHKKGEMNFFAQSIIKYIWKSFFSNKIGKFPHILLWK